MQTPAFLPGQRVRVARASVNAFAGYGGAAGARADAESLETALRFWKGSHADGAVYQAVDFAGDGEYRHLQGSRPPLPDIDRDPTAEILAIDMAPGDMLVWNSRTFHSAPGNALGKRRAAFSLNWVGDGVTFHDIPSLQTYRADGIAEGMPIACDKFPVVRQRQAGS